MVRMHMTKKIIRQIPGSFAIGRSSGKAAHGCTSAALESSPSATPTTWPILYMQLASDAHSYAANAEDEQQRRELKLTTVTMRKIA